MPLAEMSGGLARPGEELANRDFPPHQPFQSFADANRVGAGADGRTAGHKGRRAWRAMRLGIEVGQPHPFRGQPVDAWRRRASGDPSAMYADLAVAEIVHQDE